VRRSTALRALAAFGRDKKDTDMKFIPRFALLLLVGLGVAVSALAQPMTRGTGTVYLAPKGNDKPPPRPIQRTEAMAAQAAPTNQWYSALIFNAKPEPLFAHPLTVKATTAGFEMALATKQIVPTDRRDVEVHYPHREPIVFSPLAFEPEPAKLARLSDWAIDIAMARGADQLLATVSHASPFVYFRLSRGDVRLRLPAPAERVEMATDPRVLALNVAGKTYAAFGPAGVRWEQVSPTEWTGRLPAGKGYFSAATLPDPKAETLALFARHAYAFVQDTRATWRYDPATSKVETTYTFGTQVMEGADNGPLIGLYPHQWFNNASVAGRLGAAYDSIRGKIRLLAAAEFKTELTYNGFVPHWPGLKEGARFAEFNDLLKTDLRKRRELIPARENNDNWRTSIYWQGKGLTRATQLAAVAEQQGDTEGRDQLLKLVKERMEFFFTGPSKSYFMYDKGLGTVVAYPDEFFSVEQMNDHHFHYGYWIRAAAEIALRDPAWAAADKWGAMVEFLIADIATTKRGSAEFPYLRNFDTYEGHSWASGLGDGGFGNNQESSSEALNAWAGLILWGEVTGNRELRDLGIYLFTTEANAINHYWFDIHGLVFPPEYKDVEVSMVFGGKYAHNTWWTDEPRQIKGINLLPMAQFSTYLGRDPAYVKRNVGTLAQDSKTYLARGKNYNEFPKDGWQDIFAKYLALADPTAALAQWDRYGSVELGDTRAHTLHWMLSLAEMGVPDFSVTANSALHAVFRKLDGRKTYLAFNATKAPLVVRFSDGQVLNVAPGKLERAP
jgi:endoglucanase Acf2